jgi:hypothetical protein
MRILILRRCMERTMLRAKHSCSALMIKNKPYANGFVCTATKLKQ